MTRFIIKVPGPGKDEWIYLTEETDKGQELKIWDSRGYAYEEMEKWPGAILELYKGDEE